MLYLHIVRVRPQLFQPDFQAMREAEVVLDRRVQAPADPADRPRSAVEALILRPLVAPDVDYAQGLKAAGLAYRHWHEERIAQNFTFVKIIIYKPNNAV
jgi:hypothetical protein